jgi:ATP-dependent DNA ligase
LQTVREEILVTLKVVPPLSPMLGLLSDGLPEGDGWAFEPKWDGFRLLVFREGDQLDLRSRDDRPLLRYFPELAEPLLRALPEVAAVDGEVMLVSGGVLDFEALQLRLHPARSRVARLATESPASVIVWDLLAQGTDDLMQIPFAERRQRLVANVTANEQVQLTPHTVDRTIALDWFHRFEGAGLDGVMAKRLDSSYQPGKRAMVKVKHVRAVDAVVLGFRWHKNGEGSEVGSLVLGLYDEAGDVHPIGVAASFSRSERVRLAGELGPLAAPDEHPWASWGEGERRPDLRSRWNAERDLSWVPIRAGKVVEVSTTQSSPRRLRHPAKVLRWRADKPAAECTLDQLQVVPAPELSQLFR